MDVQELANYLITIVGAFVGQADRVEVTFDEFPRRIIFHLSVDANDLPALQEFQMTYRSLNHIMKKATKANLHKTGALDDQFGTTA